MSDAKVQTRESLTTRQRSILITFYNQNPYPSSSERYQLVQLTGRTAKQIQDWFSNRRRTDSKLVPIKSTAVFQPSSTSHAVTMETSYHYSSPPFTSPICSYCGLIQSFSSINQPFYPMPQSSPINYSSSDNFHS